MLGTLCAYTIGFTHELKYLRKLEIMLRNNSGSVPPDLVLMLEEDTINHIIRAQVIHASQTPFSKFNQFNTMRIEDTKEATDCPCNKNANLIRSHGHFSVSKNRWREISPTEISATCEKKASTKM